MNITQPTSGVAQSLLYVRDANTLDIEVTQAVTLSAGAALFINDHAAAGYFDIGSMRIQWGTNSNTNSGALENVTLPAPFLDSACPDGWLAALARVAATPFTIAIPGHGQPMTRAQFANYSQAFGALIGCANSSVAKTECASQWTAAVQPLLDANPKEPQRATGMAAYYVDLLRANGGRSKYCGAPPRPH